MDGRAVAVVLASTSLALGVGCGGEVERTGGGEQGQPQRAALREGRVVREKLRSNIDGSQRTPAADGQRDEQE